MNESISDRHSRNVDGLKPASEQRPLCVQVRANAAAHTPAGQHLIIALCNLLCRMTDVVAEIILDFPDASTLVVLPHRNDATTLVAAAASMVEWAVGSEVRISSAPVSAVPDLCLCVGGDVEGVEGAQALHALAKGWVAWVGLRSHAATEHSDTGSPNPLGPYFAACLLAGEVFKHSRGLERGRWIDDFGHSLWSGETGPWGELTDGPALSGAELQAIYIVGAGAVGQGLLNLIGAARLQSTFVVTLDDDRHDRTNLNRCFLAGVDDQDSSKVDVVARFRRLSGFDGFEFAGTLRDYLVGSKPGLRADLAGLEARDIYEYVVSCVDKGTSRQDLQGLWPRLIFGGSTSGLTAKTNIYDLAAGSPCLGCHNPPEKDGDTLRKLEQQVRGLTSNEQRAFFEGKVPDVQAVLDYLDAGEECGKVGEAAFRAMALASSREFSVSFVSMAAATLLASRMFSRLIFKDEAKLGRPWMTSLAFRNASISDDNLTTDGECRRCGGWPSKAFAIARGGIS